VELPGIEPAAKSGSTCGNAKCVDGVNKNRFPFQGHIRRVRVAYT
jgi:hypothetical protein